MVRWELNRKKRAEFQLLIFLCVGGGVERLCEHCTKMP